MKFIALKTMELFSFHIKFDTNFVIEIKIETYTGWVFGFYNIFCFFTYNSTVDSWWQKNISFPSWLGWKNTLDENKQKLISFERIDQM